MKGMMCKSCVGLLAVVVVGLSGCDAVNSLLGGQGRGASRAQRSASQSSTQAQARMEYQADQIAESAGLAYDNLVKDAKKLRDDASEQADELSVAATEALTQAQRAIDIRGAVQGAVKQGATDTLRAAERVVNDVARVVPRLEGGDQNPEPPPPGALAEYEIGSDPSIPKIQ